MFPTPADVPRPWVGPAQRPHATGAWELSVIHHPRHPRHPRHLDSTAQVLEPGSQAVSRRQVTLTEGTCIGLGGVRVHTRAHTVPQAAHSEHSHRGRACPRPGFLRTWQELLIHLKVIKTVFCVLRGQLSALSFLRAPCQAFAR